MLELLKNKFEKDEILEGLFGIERETLRVDKEGKLSKTKHPAVFGSKVKNPYITTDFSESQIEMITPQFESVKEAYDFLNALYDMTLLNIGDELLWPQSMPCCIPEDKDIPVSEYEECEKGKEARRYREELIKKYGGTRQLLSGIHFNFSFKDEFIKKLYREMKTPDSYKSFKDSIYLKITRNYLSYRWLIIYLLGAAPVSHKSFAIKFDAFNDVFNMEQIDESYTGEGVISYRNSDCGYKNHIDLYPDYSSTYTYIESINKFILKGHIQNSKELYSQIRPKSKNNEDLLNSLEAEGIQYIEVRSIDNNPFEKCGIALDDLEFLHLFMIYLLAKDEDKDISDNWQKEADINQKQIAQNGLLDIKLIRNGKNVGKSEWALEILEEMMIINASLNLGKAKVIEKMIERVKYPIYTYAYRIKELYRNKGFIKANLELSKAYKKDSHDNRFKFYGYEDMELSTQILMKEAVLRGITVEVLDRSDNFICLKSGDHIEYVKQATKTSKDSYITMLIMENKTVTKKVLERAGICVPKGTEVRKGQNFNTIAAKYEEKNIVIKPKSTNFGKGISIFPNGAEKADIIRALEIGFNYDDTVLIEEFAKGREYRFLVIGDETAGVLHRVPANVVGDGKKTIRELVEIKNTDSLRGTGYKTPLEKIKLDEASELFLKQSMLNFDSIPGKDETVYLRENSNISTGGDSVDYTDEMPQRYKDIAVSAAKAAGARFCGVDMMLEDYQNPEGKYAIIEINFNPAIHIHSYPYKGTERNIAKKVLKVLEFSLS